MNHVWSAPLFGRSTCFFLNYCILTWRNIIFCHETPGKIRRIGIAYHIHYFRYSESALQNQVGMDSLQAKQILEGILKLEKMDSCKPLENRQLELKRIWELNVTPQERLFHLLF